MRSARNRIRQPLLARRVNSEFERVLRLDPSNIGGREGLLQFHLQAPGIMGGSASKAREQAADIAKLSPLRGHLARATIANFEKDPSAAEREDRGGQNDAAVSFRQGERRSIFQPPLPRT